MKKRSLRLYALLTRHILTQDWICERERKEGRKEMRRGGGRGRGRRGEGRGGRVRGRGREGKEERRGEGRKERKRKLQKTTFSNNFCSCFYMK